MRDWKSSLVLKLERKKRMLVFRYSNAKQLKRSRLKKTTSKIWSKDLSKILKTLMFFIDPSAICDDLEGMLKVLSLFYNIDQLQGDRGCKGEDYINSELGTYLRWNLRPCPPVTRMSNRQPTIKNTMQMSISPDVHFVQMSASTLTSQMHFYPLTHFYHLITIYKWFSIVHKNSINLKYKPYN